MIKNIIIDPGHGGINSQGVYTTQGKSYKFPNGEIAYEGVINRNISKALGNKLKSNGFNVIYTVDPSDPNDVSLGERVRKANRYSSKDSVFVSIHNNAMGKPGTARGFEIFTTFGQNNSDKLAESIYNEVAKLYNKLNLKLRYDLSDKDHDKEAGFYVIKGANMPAVLIECLFFDNYNDYTKLKDKMFIESLANAIYLGIQNYIKQ